MRRPLIIAVGFFLAAGLPLAAQRGSAHGTGGGGGHASFGGHAGMVAHNGFTSHIGSGRPYAGHAYAGRTYSGGAYAGRRSGPAFSASGPARRSAFNRSFDRRGFNHFSDRGGVRDRRFRSFSSRNNCYGYRCGWGYGYPYLWGGIDPYWWWDSYSSYDQDRQNQIDMANQMNAESLAEQRMREQDNRAQDNREPDDPDVYARPSAPAPTQNAETAPTPATVLVFRDQHQQEVRNYAIVGPILWIFASQRTQKIPLSQLDLQATIKANDERGVEFRIPVTQEGE